MDSGVWNRVSNDKWDRTKQLLLSVAFFNIQGCSIFDANRMACGIP